MDISTIVVQMLILVLLMLVGFIGAKKIFLMMK